MRLFIKDSVSMVACKPIELQLQKIAEVASLSGQGL